MAKVISYEDIPIAWYLGDEGDLKDFKRESPWASGDFDPQLARLFLEYIQAGLTDSQACAHVPMPIKFARIWCRGSRKTPQVYLEAIEIARSEQHNRMADEIVDIADGSDVWGGEAAALGVIDNPLGKTLQKTVEINKAKLGSSKSERISSRKWYVGKKKPAEYGDKVQIDHGNAGGKPFKKVDYSKLPTETLEKLVDLDAEIRAATEDVDGDGAGS